jgi:GNAT superfamily N-acetyltransferase
MDDFSLRPLKLPDVDDAAKVISNAFVNDPLCAFMLPNKRSRLKTLNKFFRAYGQINITNQHGYGVGEPLKGVAFWLEPRQGDVSVSIRSLGVFIPLLFSLYPLGYIRARNVLRQIDTLHKKFAAEPHYYLDNIGVLPSEQRKGYSSALIRPFLEKADDEHVMVYTDTVTPENVSFYEHFGFQCVQESRQEEAGITVYALLRSNHRFKH